MRKKTMLLTLLLSGALSAAAAMATEDNGHRPMLVKGKTWCYTYHHFEAREYSDPGDDDIKITNDETTWQVRYTLKGDTVIGDRQYMKMFRHDKNSNQYYGALREDEDGRVWQYNTDDKKDFMLCDYTAKSYPEVEGTIFADVVNIGGEKLHRYNKNGFIGVEGVGFAGKGLVHYLLEPQVNCICDYESFDYVDGDAFIFTNADFRAAKYIELTDDEKQHAAKNNDFAFNLFRKARKGESQVLSPMGITLVLGMLNNGAQGKTQQEIREVLGFSDVDAQNSFCQKIQNELGTTQLYDPTTRTMTANTIFVNSGRGLQLQDDFRQKASEYYYASPENRDFGDGQTLDAINQWASDHTEKLIEKVLDEEEFNSMAVSYLLNAIYFKGDWANPFKAGDTREEPFNGGKTVPMMHKNEELSYAENSLYQTVVLPYGNNTYQMRVILPREGKTVGEVAESLNASNWQTPGSIYEVDLKLPRFETDTSIDLKPVMSALGMTTAFDPIEADFTKLCVSNDNIVNAFIALFKQVGKIKVSEEGTEAAAVTIVEMDEGIGITNYADFHATRPFIYIISERSTGVILFIGQYMGDDTAGLAETMSMKTTGTENCYNLNGQRLQTPPARGLFIKGGRKIIR